MKSIQVISLGLKTRVMLISLLFTSVAACTPSRFSADGLCEAQAKAACHFEFQCCNASERDFFGHPGSAYNDEASCNEVYTRAFCADANQTMGSVDADRAAWDEAKAEECYGPMLDALDSCDATTVFTFGMNKAPDACKEIVAGKVADDGVCFENYECATEGARCRNNGEGQNMPIDPNAPVDPSKQVITAEGTCVPPAAEGEDCQMTQCASKLYCAIDPMSNSAKCARLKADGEECMGPDQCQSGSCFSVDYNVVAPTCGPKLADGQPCQIPDQCQSGYCSYDTQTCGIEESTMPTFNICTGKNE